VPTFRRPLRFHAFGLTPSKVVVLEPPTAISVPAMLGLAEASHGSVQWRPEQGTKVHVLDRRSGAVATRTLFPAFFFFHVARTFDHQTAPCPSARPLTRLSIATPPHALLRSGGQRL
jgi:carotenoid cleavage dioxygenase-like enzyme